MRTAVLALGVACGAWLAVSPAPAQEAPAPAPSKPLSKAELNRFADALGIWLLYGDDEKLAESDKRAKKLDDLKKYEHRNWKGARQAFNGWLPNGVRPQKRKVTTELTYRYDATKTPWNKIMFGEASGYRPGRPTPLCIALHGGGRGQGDPGQAYGMYGAPFKAKGCFLVAPLVPGEKLTFAHPHSERFVRNFIHELQREYSIDFDRIYVVGHSEGGVGAWAFGARMPDYIAAAVAGAGNPPGVLDYEYLYNTPMWIHHSTTDKQVIPDWDKAAEEAVKKIQPPLREFHFVWYEATDGRGHGYPAWVPEKYEPWVLEQTRDMYPKRVVTCCPIARARDVHGFVDYPGDETEWDNFWVGIRGLSGGQGKVIAELKGPNHIGATSTGVAKVVFYVSDEFLDLDKPIRVVLNGVEAWNKPVPRSAEYLCRHIARHDDRGRFFSGEIEVAGDGTGASSSGSDDDDD